MKDLITGADSVSKEYLQQVSKREAILAELDRQKKRNQKTIERQNKQIEKLNQTGKTDKSRVATQRIQQAEQALASIEALEANDNPLAASLKYGTLADDLRDPEAEQRDKVQEAFLTVLKAQEKNNKMKAQITDEELDALLEDNKETEVLSIEQEDVHYIDGKMRRIVGTEGLNLDVIDQERFSRKSPTPDIAKREQAIKEKTGQITPAKSAGVSPYMPTTNTEMQQLLLALNINMNAKMTSKETADLLKTLLTCNETQLLALYNNAKLPVALKIIIKRILADIRNGNTETVERLWDRIFGKTGMSDAGAAGDVMSTGINQIIPGAPISREAYVLIRDTIINK